jgi:hypothetical protein
MCSWGDIHIFRKVINYIYSKMYLLDANHVHLEHNTYWINKLNLEVASIAPKLLQYVWVARILAHNQNIGEKITELLYSLDA